LAKNSHIPLLPEARIQKTAKKISCGFAVFAVCTALITFYAWYVPGESLKPALLNAASVLFLAFPCMFGFASGSSVMTGIAKAAENGLLVKSGEKLESLSKATAVVFGKTGVITSFSPRVTDVVAMPRFFEEEVIAFAAAAEKNSTHPLGTAIYEYAQPDVITGLLQEKTIRTGKHDIVSIHSENHGFIGSVPDAQAFEPVEGGGVSALVGGREVLVGTRKLLTERGVDVTQFEHAAQELERAGKTAMLVAINKKPAGIIAATEAMKPSACDAIRALSDMGVEVSLMTEDSDVTVNPIAKDADIRHVFHCVSPKVKAHIIENLKDNGAVVSVVGGKNDAAALMAADAAITSGLDMPESAAGIVLASDDLNAVPAAIKFARAAMGKIKRNIIFALIISGAGMPLAVAGMIPPLMACGITVFVSALILISSTR